MQRPGPTDTKVAWRRWVRELPPPTDHDEVCRHLAAHLGAGHAVIAAYEVLPGEVDLAALLAELAGEVALPRLVGDLVTWHLPDGSPVEPEQLDVVLVPGRLFDRRGFRLGRGGGHYDRLLPRLRPGVDTIGVTVDDRVVARLPTEGHDVPMTHLATQSGVSPVR